MSLTRRLLLLLVLVSALSNASGGTGATFTATTTNPSATFATGSLVLGNDVDASGVCLSTGGGNTDTNSNACDAAFELALKKPGDPEVTVDLDISNEGNLDGTLTLAATGDCVSGLDGDTPYHGTGDLCTVIRYQVQEFTDEAERTAGTPTGTSTCHYGGGTATDCAEDAGKTLADFGAVHKAGGTSGPIAMGTLSAGTTRYFRLYLKIDSSVGNDFQGLIATSGLSWQLAQT